MAPVARRGQILLIAAFALAVIFVALALVINTAIFTENLASQGPVTGADETRDLRQEVNRSIGELLAYENRNGGASESVLRDNVGALETVLARSEILDGRDVSVELTSSQPGKYIADMNSSGSNFTNASNVPDWQLAEDVPRTRALEFELVAANGSFANNTAFQVNVSNSKGNTTEVWLLEIGKESGNPTLIVDPPGASPEQCSLSGRSYPVDLDVMGAQFGGEYCPALDDYPFAQGVSAPYNISFHNSQSPRIRGNYSMVLDGSAIVVFRPLAGPSYYPHRKDGLYSVKVDIEVLSHDLTYSDVIRVAPGEP